MVKITPAVLELLRQRGVYSRHDGGDRWKVGDELAFAPGTRIEPYTHIFGGLTLPSSMGAFSYAQSRTLPILRIGRYCSLAAGLTVMGNSHPTDWSMTSPVFHDIKPLPGLRNFLRTERSQATFRVQPYTYLSDPIFIGNDVWIGLGATIKGGVTIGDGAIVGAQAVVTKNVPPYAIVGGTPARLIRMRFPDEIIARFLELKPWRFAPDDLVSLRPNTPEKFLDALQRKTASGEMAPLNLTPLSDEELTAASERSA